MALDSQTITDAANAVAPLAQQLRIAEQVKPYGRLRWRNEAEDWPTLHIDDVSEIPFLDGIPGVERYQHRSRVRARTGDLFAATTDVPAGYEPYCRDRLGLGSPQFLHPAPAGGALELARACQEGDALRQLIEFAQKRGRFALHPYMGTEPSWNLAKKIAEHVPCAVLAPPPPVTWLANDKALLSETVRLVLGNEWIVETETHTIADNMAKAMHDLAGRHQRVGLKRTRCASAMGNMVFDSSALRAAGPAGVRKEVDDFLRHTRWMGDEEVLCVAWEVTDCSPSTQIWIPPAGSGPPRLEGIYEQLLEGEERVFLGSVPSTLPAIINQRLGDASLQIAAAFQSLGYVGRCSFDLLVLGELSESPAIHFTECNGRWGGTSTPMHLVDRLLGCDFATRPSYLAQDFVREELVGVPFADILARTGKRLFDPREKTGDFIYYNVGPLEHSGKLDVIAIADNVEQARHKVAVDLPELLGL